MRALAILLLLLACSPPPGGAAESRIRFGRGALWSSRPLRGVRDAGGAAVAFETTAVASGVLARFPPDRGARYEIELASGERLRATAPLAPEPIELFAADLADELPFDPEVHRAHVPTTVAFSPRADVVYLGTSEGFQVVYAVPSGRATRLPRLPLAYLRGAVFAPDGARLYVGEQSRTGSVHAYASGSWAPLWERPLFDRPHEVPASEVDPVYAWAHEPGAYRLLPVGDDLIVVANHSWTAGGEHGFGGRFGNRARLLRLAGADGRVVWTWPPQGDLPLKITWCDAAGGVVALVAHFAEWQRAEAPLAGDVAPGTLIVLDERTGRELGRHTFAPLAPYFSHTECWRGTAVAGGGRAVAVALDDGRVFTFAVDPGAGAGAVHETGTRDLTTPLDVGGAPILATAGTIARAGDSLLVATGNTYTPWIVRADDVRPPQPHPNGRTLFGFGFDLRTQWRFALENDVEGLAVSQAPLVVAVSLSSVADPGPGDVNGASVFALDRAGGGLEKWQYTYTFAGIAPYDAVAVSSDGALIALVEMPYLPRTGGARKGAARLHVLH